MKVQELEKKLAYTPVYSPYPDSEAVAAFTSDLLSDVMGKAPHESVLITIQAHKNTIAVATLANMKAVIICSDRPVPQDMIEAAKTEEIALFLTSDDQFTASWKIAGLLNLT